MEHIHTGPDWYIVAAVISWLWLLAVVTAIWVRGNW